MSSLDPTTTERLREIFAGMPDVDTAVVFGSVARGRARRAAHRDRHLQAFAAAMAGDIEE